MELHDLGRTLLRRWYVLLLCLLLAGAGTWWVWERTPVQFSATANAVLVPPTTAVVDGANPYLFMGSLDQGLSVLLVRMNSQAVVDRVKQAAPDAGYTIIQDPATTGPIMLLTATGPTPGSALDALEAARSQVDPELLKLQEQLKVPRNARITVLSIAQDTTATEQAKDRQRLSIVAACAGLALSFLAVALLDRLFLALGRRRRRRRAGAQEAVAVAPGGVDDDATNESGSTPGEPGKDPEADPERDAGREPESEPAAVGEPRS